MTDTDHSQIDSPLSRSSSSSSSDGSIIINIKRKRTLKTSTTKRRSQRRRTNVQLPMRSSSLATTILHENIRVKEQESEIINDNTNQQLEKQSSSSDLPDKLLFPTTTSSPPPSAPKSSYWTVTDRQTEWYKLSIPINQSITHDKNKLVPYKTLSKIGQRKKANLNNIDRIDRPTDTTQLIMKAVMHELDYDMDEDDLKYLNELNQYNKIKQKRQMTEEEFENAIIILEFSTAEKIRAHLKQKACEDEDILCDICLLPDADDENEMVFCERCNCCVHQKCYGIPVVPTGTWLCKPCSILRRPACILCPKLGGPMKCTASGTIWCHITCALWLPELKFVDYVKMEPIVYFNKISHARWSLRCVVCSTTEGACVQCAHKNCRTPFHVTCGLSAGYFLDVQQTPSKESASSRSQFNAYCIKHSDEARKRSEQESSSLLSNKDDNSSCSLVDSPIIPCTVYRREQLKVDQWLNECYKNFSTFISSSHLHEECSTDYEEYLSKKIYEYWVNKRQINKTLPLIKRIDFVLEQRENAELLIAQINTCLKTRQKMLQLHTRCESILNSSSSSSSLTQRFESLKKAMSSSSTSHSLHGENEHENKNKIKSLKRHRRRKLFYSTEQYNTIERAKRCMVILESTYRNNLKLNTTYFVGKTIEGQIFLLPKQLIEQANVIRLTDNDQRANIFPSIDYSDVSDDDDDDEEPLRKRKTFHTTKPPYTSQGNVVTCTTGSFN